MSVGRESGHVNSNNRKDCFGTIRTNASNSVNGVYGIGEYFRVFVSYGVIAMALVMHAWSGVSRKKRPESVSEKA